MKNIQLELTIDETNLILEALGALPFARVYNLIGKIQECARKQIDGPAAEAVGVSGPNGSNGADREHVR